MSNKRLFFTAWVFLFLVSVPLQRFIYPSPTPAEPQRAALARKSKHTKPTLSPLVIGELRATVYHAVAGQCDATPFLTADDSRITPGKESKLRWCAVSRGLHRRWRGPLNFGDTLLVTQAGRLNGRWVVRDLMRNVHERRIDFLVSPRAGHDPDQGRVYVYRLCHRRQPHKTLKT